MHKIIEKEIKFNGSLVDVYVYETMEPHAYKKLHYCCPLRLIDKKRPAIFFNGRVFPLFLNENEQLIIIKNGASLIEKNCDQLLTNLFYNVPYAWGAKKNCLKDINCSWHIESNQFGLYIYISASDALIEKLIISLSTKGKYKIITWDGLKTEKKNLIKYQWYIKLYSGLSQVGISSFLNDFFSSYTVPKKQNNSEVILLSEKLEQAEHRLKELADSNEIEIELLREELANAYKEISNLNEELNIYIEKETLEKDLLINKYSAKQFRKTQVEKLTAAMLRHSYLNLAFHPNSVNIILEKFSHSKELWHVLKIINDNKHIERKIIKGIPKKLGWWEIAKHINTGKDIRGRIYLRESIKAHQFDVVLHWKKDNTEQTRFFKKLITLTYFKSPDVIFL